MLLYVDIYISNFTFRGGFKMGFIHKKEPTTNEGLVDMFTKNVIFFFNSSTKKRGNEKKYEPLRSKGGGVPGP